MRNKKKLKKKNSKKSWGKLFVRLQQSPLLLVANEQQQHVAKTAPRGNTSSQLAKKSCDHFGKTQWKSEGANEWGKAGKSTYIRYYILFISSL